MPRLISRAGLILLVFKCHAPYALRPQWVPPVPCPTSFVGAGPSRRDVFKGLISVSAVLPAAAAVAQDTPATVLPAAVAVAQDTAMTTFPFSITFTEPSIGLELIADSTVKGGLLVKGVIRKSPAALKGVRAPSKLTMINEQVGASHFNTSSCDRRAPKKVALRS